MLGAARDRQVVARQISNEWVQANAKQTSKEASREASKCIQIQSVTTTISINDMNSCVAACRFRRGGSSMRFWLLCRKVAPVARKTSSRATSFLSFSFWALIGYNANKPDCHSIIPPACQRPACQSKVQLVFRISCPLPLACALRPLLHILNLFASPPVLLHALTILEHR